MSNRAEISPDQLVIPPYCEELVREEQYPEVNPDSRIVLPSLIDIVSTTVRFGREPKYSDYMHADPEYINGGLVIAPKDRDYDKALHVVRIGVWRNGRHPDQVGVVFPPHEYATVARSARDLGQHAANQTRASRWSSTDRKGSKEGTMRSGGHVLTEKIAKQTSLASRFSEESNIMRKLLEHLYRPSKVRIRAKTLKSYLALTDERVHETAEIASIAHGLDEDNFAVLGLHKAIRKNMFGGNQSHAQRTYQLVRYIKMVGVHIARKNGKLELSKERCEQELTQYQPYIDAKDERERQQAATAQATTQDNA